MPFAGPDRPFAGRSEATDRVARKVLSVAGHLAAERIEMENREIHDGRRDRRRTTTRLVFGAFLMLIGGLLIADNLGFDVPAGVWSYWPFLLIGLGVAKLALDEGEGRSGGFWLVVAGVYGWLSIFRIAGLHWGSAWPVFLLAAGLWILVGRAVCGTPPARLEEKSDAR